MFIFYIKKNQFTDIKYFFPNKNLNFLTNKISFNIELRNSTKQIIFSSTTIASLNSNVPATETIGGRWSKHDRNCFIVAAHFGRRAVRGGGRWSRLLNADLDPCWIRCCCCC